MKIVYHENCHGHHVMLMVKSAIAVPTSTDRNPIKSKSKCLYIKGRQQVTSITEPLLLCGRELPWVTSATHLGHELSDCGTMDQDTIVKRAKFINESVQIRAMFHFASQFEIMKALKVYCTSFYGCMLWDLAGDRSTQVFNAWNMAVKLVWGVSKNDKEVPGTESPQFWHVLSQDRHNC